jgi:hypothetical protein
MALYDKRMTDSNGDKVADNRVIFRKNETVESAYAKAKERWPTLAASDIWRRIIEQWNFAQDTGTSKTQKIADIDARLTQHGVVLAEIANTTLTLVERVERMGQLLVEFVRIVEEIKQQLAEHGFEEE